MKNHIEKLSYALGINIGSSLKPQGVDEVDVQKLVDGINDVVSGSKPKMEMDEVRTILNDHFSKLQARMNEQVIKVQEAFLNENSKKEGVVTLESGLQYQVLVEGDGAKPKLESKVTTHYHGTTIDGTVFDSSVERGSPISFPVNGVIPGWTEALQLMSIGSKWRLFIPSALAYGEKGAGAQIGPYATLIFEVELLGIE